MKSEYFVVLPGYYVNCALVWDENTKEAMLIDPGEETKEIANFMQQHELKLLYIVNTHGHCDHIGGNRYFQEKFRAKIAIHALDADCLPHPQKNLSSYAQLAVTSPQADVILQENDVISVGSAEFRIIHTPGHTMGGICLYNEKEKLLFAGDTLFNESVGRTDFPGGNSGQLIQSIREKLFILPGETKVIPGHGEFTSIEHEIMTNPFAGKIAGYEI